MNKLDEYLEHCAKMNEEKLEYKKKLSSLAETLLNLLSDDDLHSRYAASYALKTIIGNKLDKDDPIVLSIVNKLIRMLSDSADDYNMLKHSVANTLKIIIADNNDLLLKVIDDFIKLLQSSKWKGAAFGLAKLCSDNSRLRIVTIIRLVELMKSNEEMKLVIVDTLTYIENFANNKDYEEEENDK